MRNRWLGVAAIVVMLIFSAVIYSQLPDEIPVQWGFDGQPNRYQPKLIGVLTLPFFALLVIVLRTGLRRIDPRRENYEKFEDTYWLYINVTIFALAVVHVLGLGASAGWELPIARIGLVLAGVVMMIIANEARRVTPNWFLGVRTPWTLSDADVWRETHSVAGRALFAVGALMVLLGLLVAPQIAGIVTLTAAVGVTAFLFFYSYRAYRRRHP